MPNILSMLLGAALVALGVLAAALADRIRGIRAREIAAPRRASVQATSRVIEPAEVLVEAPAITRRQARGSKTQDAAQRLDGMAGDVVAALVAAGYRKSVAAEAVEGCGATERATIEGWTTAALRRCTKGGAS